MHTCTRCNGTGLVTGLAKYKDKGFRWMKTRCFTCDGTGRRSEDDLAREGAGARLRQVRMGSQYLTQREAAKVLGLDQAGYSALEFGKPGTTRAQIQAATVALRGYLASRLEVGTSESSFRAEGFC